MNWQQIPTQTLITIVLAAVLFLLATFYIVKAAVKSALKSVRLSTNDKMVHEAIRLSNRLKIQDLLLRGVHPDRIRELQDLANNPFD
jgi:hypothetical protein